MDGTNGGYSDNESTALCGENRQDLSKWRACGVGVGWDRGKLVFPGMERLSFRKKITGPQEQEACYDEENVRPRDHEAIAAAADTRTSWDNNNPSVNANGNANGITIAMVAREQSANSQALPSISSGGMAVPTTPRSGIEMCSPLSSSCASRSRHHSWGSEGGSPSQCLGNNGGSSPSSAVKSSPLKSPGVSSPVVKTSPLHETRICVGDVVRRGSSIGGDDEEEAGGGATRVGDTNSDSDSCCDQQDCSVADGKVWEEVLPADYEDICGAVYPEPLSCDDKREVYSRLAAGVLLHGGFYSYRLMKRQGSDRASAAIAISSSFMSIVWGHDIRHWEEVKCPASSFGRVMVLHRVHWFDVSGRISWQFPPGVYTCAWRLSRTMTPKFLENVATFWGRQPAESIVRTSDGQTVRLWLPLSDQTVVAQPEWMEWQAGEIVVPEVEGSKLTKVDIDFALRETNFDSVKMGLLVDCFMIYESDPENMTNDRDCPPSGRRVRDGSSAVFIEEERPNTGSFMWKMAGERLLAALRYVADPLNSTGLAES